MAAHDVDLFVVGGGSGGVRAARVAASLGARVVLAEDRRLGGTCVNVGCIPKKILSYGAHVAHDLEAARGLGWSFRDAALDWKELRAKTDAEVLRLNGAYRSMLERAEIEVIDGRASLEGPGLVRVGSRLVRARHVLIATGGRPHRPASSGAELAWVSDDVFTIERVPSKVIVVGAGYIGLELASVLNSAGAEVVVTSRSASVLSHFDPDVGSHVRAELEKRGIRFAMGGACQRIERQGMDLVVAGGGDEPLRAPAVLLAVGRDPEVAGLGLETSGVRLGSDGHIAVSETFETSAPGVYAVGDVVGRMQLTPVAIAEGQAVARTLYADEGPCRVDYQNVATAVFAGPPVATVGLTEPQARAAGHEVSVFRSTFRPLRDVTAGTADRSFMKLVVDSATDRVLGVHVVGTDAPEIVQGFAVALKCGATKAQFDSTIGIHPTAAEELVTMRTPS